MNDPANTGPSKVGIISCSGEEIPEGTISRLATLRVLRTLRPDASVTICLPLFLAGERGERNFAKTHPTITVDGCEKRCAQWGTEQHSGPVTRSLVVSDILGDRLWRLPTLDAIARPLGRKGRAHRRRTDSVRCR